MLKVKEGDVVQFRYHDKMRKGRVERTWPSYRGGLKAGGFCLDHGGFYKSYSNNKIKYLAKVSGQGKEEK